MVISNLKSTLLVVAMGLTLIGCSSEPVIEDKTESTATKVEKTGSTEGGATTSATETADTLSSMPTNSDGLTAEQLLAEIQGRVVNFDFDRAEVKENFHELVKKTADYMSLESSASVTLKGYADERGTPEYNLALGERRGNSVQNALIAEGVSPSRINVVSYGEENPVDIRHNKTAWSKNRRVEFSY